MGNAQGTVAVCLTLAIFFVGVRMRALRLTNNRGAPQGYVQDGMHCATWAVLIQYLMVCLISVAVHVMEGKDAEHPKTDLNGNISHREWSKGGMIMLWIFEFVRCLGFTAVIYSVCTIQHPKGEEYTPPISVTMQCVIKLAVQYFLGFLLIWTVVSVEELTG